MSVAAEKKSTNSVFLDSALMMAIIIGVPCLLVVIAVVLCVRKRCKSIDKKYVTDIHVPQFSFDVIPSNISPVGFIVQKTREREATRRD